MTSSLDDDLTTADLTGIAWTITGTDRFVSVTYTSRQGRCAHVRYGEDGTPLDASVDEQPLPGTVIRSSALPQVLFDYSPVRVTALHLDSPGMLHDLLVAGGRSSVPDLVVACGPPAAGKSSLAAYLRDVEGWVWVDKDTDGDVMSRPIMESLQRSPDDRDSDEYRRFALPLAYRLLADSATVQLDAGAKVVVEEPFLEQAHVAAAQNITLGELLHRSFGLPGDALTVWVTADAPVRRERMALRGEDRDAGKLVDWTSYIAMAEQWPSPGVVDAVVSV